MDTGRLRESVKDIGDKIRTSEGETSDDGGDEVSNVMDQPFRLLSPPTFMTPRTE